MTSVTSPTHVRALALEYAAVKRSHKFTRVSQAFLDAVEANTRGFIMNRVQSHPSKGQTLL